jgi:hypothetical protein
MASADTEERGYARVGSAVATEGGNPGESDDESPEGLEARQEGPGMPKTDAITSCAGKCIRRPSEWRMRSPSEEEWDNITHLERGPQGSGGLVS